MIGLCFTVAGSTGRSTVSGLLFDDNDLFGSAGVGGGRHHGHVLHHSLASLGPDDGSDDCEEADDSEGDEEPHPPASASGGIAVVEVTDLVTRHSIRFINYSNYNRNSLY